MAEELGKIRAAIKTLLTTKPENPATRKARLAALKTLEKQGLVVPEDEEVLLTGRAARAEHVVHNFTALAVAKGAARDERAPCITMDIQCHTNANGRTVCEAKPSRGL